MPDNVQVELDSGFARVTFLAPGLAGRGLAALLQAGGPGLIDVDTSGRRRSYTVPESIAREAGLIDAPKRKRKAKAAKDDQAAAPPADTVADDGLADMSDARE